MFLFKLLHQVRCVLAAHANLELTQLAATADAVVEANVATSAGRLSATTVDRPHATAAQQFFCPPTNDDTNDTPILPLAPAIADTGTCSNLGWKEQIAAVVRNELQTHKVGSGGLTNSHQQTGNNPQHSNNSDWC